MLDNFSFDQSPVSPEKGISGAIDFVDSYHTKIGDPREPRKRKERCGDIAREVQMSAAKKGLSLPMIEVARLHKLFGGDPDKAFVHYANLGKDLGVLVDLTFCQFIDEAGKISQGDNPASGSIGEHPAAENLLRDGLMPLTDETLRDYLSATTIAGDKSYIANATVEALRGQRLI